MKHIFTFLLFLLLLSNAELEAQSVERGPYLQMIGTERVNIRWRTDENTSSKVWYGLSPNSLNQTLGTNNQSEDHEVIISGLQANTKYYYAIGTASEQLAGADNNHYFITSPESTTDETINIWVLGDAGKRNNDQRNVRDAFYNHHGDSPIHMALLLGDNAYSDGTDYEYQTAWFEDMYEDRLINMPMFSAYGNHDAYSANSTYETGPYYDIFSFPKNAEIGGVPSGHEGFYSVDYGDIHIISLNDYDEDMTTSGEQYQWLEADLEANDKNWIFVICHYAPHDGRSGHSDNSDESVAIREVYMPLLESYGVDLILAGHSHSYQRSHLVSGFYGTSNEFDENIHGLDMGDGQADGDGAYQKGEDNVGTMFVVSGSAGSRASLNDDFENPVMAVNHMMLGSVRLQLTENKLFGEFINDDGIIMDYWTLEKDVPTSGPEYFSITNPLQDGFAQPQPIIVTHEFTDTTDELMEVRYYVNGLLEGTVTDFPFYWNYSIPQNGNYEIKAVATTVSGVEYDDRTEFRVGSVEICKTIVIASDDAEEKASGSMSVGSSDLELGQDGTAQQIGLRFTNLGISKDAEITAAHIQFTTDETNNINPSQLRIYGEASDNPESYNSDPFGISTRPKTNNFMDWSPSAWLVEDESETAQKTPDLSAVLQELVNRSGYSKDAPLAFVITGQGRRTAHSFDGGGSQQAPKLCISYIPDYPNDSDGDGTIDSEDLCQDGLEIGSPCNDFSEITYIDSIGPNCDCVGIAYDCATYLADIGTACDDGDATTIDDVLNSNCECLGTSIFDCPTLSANTGAPCDDGNPVTYDDVLDANCNCVGIPFDCPIYLADIGTSCDDGNPVTYNDVLDANCNCVGTPFDCPIYLADIGATCDDGNPTTMGDALNENCNCEGTSIFDCPALSQNFGDSCNDGNPNTFDDVITENCECLGNETPYDCPLLSANIGDPCDDGNPISFNDIINNNCECKGTITDYECPLLGLNYGDACDDNDPETSNDVITENCTCEGTSSTATITVEIPVAASNDDAEEKPSGSVSLTSSDLELAVDGSNIMKIGIRFRNPEIPVGAVITNAYVQFQTDETKNLDPVSISIFGEAHDNSPVFVKAGFNISNRAKTAMVIDWSNIPAWNVKGERAEAQQTTNIATIIQEIINRPGYNYNNAITLLMEGSGRRVAESFDGDVLGAPALVITYSFDCDDDDNDGICNQQDDCPQSPNNPGTPCNDGNSDTVNDVIDSNCECHGSEPVGAACAKIITSWDDGEEKADGAVKLSSSDLELVQESSLQTVGMRFQDMLIPPGATITNAYLQFTVDETANLNPCELIIHGQADGNPSQFAKIDYNISSRPKTNEFVIWTPEDWITKDVAGDAQRTLNLSPVIQEIVNRSDYNAGNPIVLILEGTGRRVAKSFESGAASSPELCVEFDLQNNNTSDKAEEHSLLEEGSINLASDLKVYPNPASDYLNLVFNSSDKDEITTIQVIDINGKVLLEKSQEIIAGTKTLSIEPLNLPNGAYYLRLNMQQRVLMGQFVIVR